MYGHHPHFPPAGGGSGGGHPEAAPSLNPYFPIQSPNIYLQNHAIQFLQNPTNFPVRNPTNFPLQNPINFPLQNPNFPLQNPNFAIQAPDVPVQSPSFPPQQFHNAGYKQTQSFTQNPKEILERMDRAAVKAHCELIAAGESVSAWKVSQSALLMLQVDSWSSLGFRMQEVPSLHHLMVTEGKINAFIHCFVGARQITSLYDLEVAICKNEKIEQFEKLELGPLLSHPLIIHYFMNYDATEVYKITSEEIIFFLSEFMDTCKKKDITIDEFLDFIAKKRSVKGKEKLGVRIQNLKMHISFIREARRLEDAMVKKCREGLQQKSDKKRQKKRPLFSSQKMQLDERFSSISQRIKSFSSVQKEFSGKHVRFCSSSSEEEDSDDCTHENKKNKNDVGGQFKISSENISGSDRVSSCPYPSAIEEMTRLGLKGEMNSQPSASGSSGHNESIGPFKKKRKFENLSCTISASPTLIKRDRVKQDVLSIKNGNETKEAIDLTGADISLSNDSMRMFVTTWKEACRENTVAEVFDRMLQFYKPTDYKKAARERRRMIVMFSSYPCVGLLNVAVKSIKCGMWDSIYDTFLTINQDEFANTLSDKHSEYESIDVEPSKKNALVITEHVMQHKHSVPVEEVIRKVATYFELDGEIQSNGKSFLEKKLIILRKLYHCEFWLAEQFCVKEFKSLGYGELALFLEKHISLLPTELLNFLAGELCENSHLEACMLQNLLIVLVSQASNSLWEDEIITKQMIDALLMRQFPLLSFEIRENGSMENFLEIVRKYKNNVISKCVLFSATLSGMCHIGDSLAHNENYLLESTTVGTVNGHKTRTLGYVTSKNAIEVLLRAPMLSDLNSWSHWDLVFAPSLGPLVRWLLNEVNAKELLCLVTRDGKVIRIDHSATVDSFLEAALQGTSFQTAVELLSLFSLAGGEKHVPLSLLKCHARHAFEVILKNYLEILEVSDSGNSLMPGNALPVHQKTDEVASDNLSHDLHKKANKMNKAVPVASRFVLDCLSYLPSEFRGVAADIFLSGLRSVIKDAPSAILCECKQTKHRIMLHEVGLSHGIVEWIDDYHAFHCTATADLFLSNGASGSKDVENELGTGSRHIRNVLDKLSCTEGEMSSSVVADGHNEECSKVSLITDGLEVSGDGIGNRCTKLLYEGNEHKNAAMVIESIRRDEFGLDPNLSGMESSMLKKQHARLGRALHCLSQELYSQDSHFLLELVQNADDNIYLENVEPTLTFILQESGIIVLNNEQGFSALNIRALCDVGNSTKKGSGTGYIGQKGIGFKSVFRVTDAPEIHSNGFHVKFDITEGEIGFVLPTLVPPCNINLFSRLASRDTIQLDDKCWNTCIVLPFRSKLSQGIAANSIVAMFSDLHPSLLLFLHRLQCIIFRNLLNDSLIVMRKETAGDGIIKVSCGKDKMTWFVASQKLQADAIRRDVQTTKISIAFTLQVSDNGDYIPLLCQQPVFAFLPLRTYGLKFILQGDFVLPSSREEVDGDSPWNQWLLSEFPGLFVSAETSFCALPCFRDYPGKAVAAYMSFVPLVGEVHGFFSCLPRMIISKLRMSNCLLLEGDNTQWVPPCKVLRGWNEQARILLPDGLLREHLGLGFLDKDIVLSDSLARALGIEEYGPKVLLQIISSLCHSENGLKSMGLGWLSSWLNALYTMYFHSSGQTSLRSGVETDLIDSLRKIPFIPLSDGTYSSTDEGTIWLHSDPITTGFDAGHGLEAFPKLCGKLRTVSRALFSASAVNISYMDVSLADNLTRMLHKIGVQELSAHEIIKVHILPAICDDRITNSDKNLLIDYLCFVMIHLQSSCPSCCLEREYIISELRNKAFILTNHGFKRPVEISVYFSEEFGNPVNVNRMINVMDMKWHEVDIIYLNHPATASLSRGLIKWREFFQEIGVTDFVKVVQVDKSIADISHTVFKNMMCDGDLISRVSVVKDWESHELVHLISLLSTSVNRESCRYLLEVLDTLWDECFSDKATAYCSFKASADSRPFRSSFMSNICDFQWVVSSMDDKLHCPKDLFYDCDAVRSILGASAPYAVPKVKSGKLLSDIGFKMKVTLDDILEILKLWRSESSFKASIAQMSKLYTLIWNEMVASKQKIAEEFHSGPSIFVPFASSSRYDDVVSGVFLSSEEVYWLDSTGTVDQMKEIHPQSCSIGATQHLLNKTLCNVYPGLHDFFVKECGVHEIPSFRSYLQILCQLANVALPSQAANAVFQVFLKWADELKSGLLSSEDIIHLKESLIKLEYTVLPTVQDKWVSLHPSFGLVCWCDDKKLKKRFKHLDNIDFLYFGKLSDNDQEMLETKVSILMQTLGIPALSEVVTREAIHHGLADSSFKVSLVNWALPYAQRYIYSLHPDKYLKLKQSGFDNLYHLQIVVVEKLFYRNAVKSCGGASKKRFECSCLLQGNILYATQESDSHSLFMELSRLLFDGTPELHLANFLHMITTMAESGSTEEQTEFFILNSQKVPKLPDEESAWSLLPAPCSTENDELLQNSFASTIINEQNSSNSKRKARMKSNWPPLDWKTAPGFSYARENGFKTQAAVAQPNSSSKKIEGDDSKGVETQMCNVVPIEINANLTIGVNSATTSPALIFPDTENIDKRFGLARNQSDSGMNIVFDPVDLDLVSDGPELGSSKYSRRDRLSTGMPNPAQAMMTGRLGEQVAFKYFAASLAGKVVRWVNEDNETGLPYDIVVGENENHTEYIEVKSTISARKDWFKITMREWQFAVEKGESFSVAHVLLGNNAAQVLVFKNPVKLCQLGQLQLAVMMPKEQKEFSTSS